MIHLVFNGRGDQLVASCGDGLARVYRLEPVGTELRMRLAFSALSNVGHMSTTIIPLRPLFVDHDRNLIVYGREGHSVTMPHQEKKFANW